MRLNSCVVWIIGRWFKMNWIYSLNWSLGLNNLIWREIRSRPKAISKIDLDENLNFQSNLMKNRSQYLHHRDCFLENPNFESFFSLLIFFYILLSLSMWNHFYFEFSSWIVNPISLNHNHFFCPHSSLNYQK